MTLPTLTVSMGRSGWQLGVPGKSELGVTTGLGISSFSNITMPSLSVKIRRGRDHELNRYQTGRCELDLINQDGAFNSGNQQSPYYPDIRPMVPLKVEATFSAVTYSLFSGFIEGWPASWEGAHRMGNDRVHVTAVDAQKVLNLAEVNVERGQELTGARINGLLDAVAWPASLRAIDAGQSQVQAVTLTDTGILQHIHDVATSESGQFFIAKDGKATFLDRFHLTVLDEVNDVWGDVPGEKHYAKITTSDDDENIWNRIVVQAPGFADQIAEDESSKSQYGGPSLAPRTLPVPTFLISTADMLARAEQLLAKYKDRKRRVTSLLLDNASLDDTQWPRVLLHDMHARVLVRKRPAGDLIDQPSFIEGIDWDISSESWRLTWRLSSTAAQQGQWQLGVAGKSELGVTTSLVEL